MGTGASAALEQSSPEEKKQALTSIPPATVSKLKTILESIASDEGVAYTLYVKEKGIHSMKVMLFLAEANLLKQVTIVSELKMPEEERNAIKEKFKDEIEDLDAGGGAGGETWIPCLKTSDGFVIDDSKIIDHLAAKHGVATDKLQAYAMFNHGVLKDYELMQRETHRLAGGDELPGGEAWFKAIDKDGSGDVSLEEMIQGLDLTRLMAEARRGVEVNTKFDRWKVANEQIDFLVASKPDFVNGWKLRMVLGTISDDYDKIIDSADKIVSLKAGDAQALTLKAFYTKALGRDSFASTMEILCASNPGIAEKAQKIISTIGKYWDTELTLTVPSGITERMSIIALGSPADDDGTPRPRLLGTLNKALEAAQAYPDADIFVTGAAVSSNMPEAIAMTRWLTARGVDEKRITKEMKAMDTVGNYVYIAPMLRARGVSKVMLITVYYHLNRSSGLADAVFEQQGLKIDVVGVAGESDLKGDKLETRMAVEKPASYRDLARAANLYEACDFE
jgi:uncharacterized SAM-binding protein YcdF (DUF218 family)